MTTAIGQVRFGDGEIWWTAYRGVSDSLDFRLLPGSDGQCHCEGGAEDVELATDYGDGMHWAGRACKKCAAIVEGISLYKHESLDGTVVVPGVEKIEKGLPAWWDYGEELE